MLDMQTFVVTYALISFVVAILFGLQWRQHRSRYTGPGYWMISYSSFFIGLFLALSGYIDHTLSHFITIMVAHVFLALTLIFLLQGMFSFFNRSSSQKFNLSLLLVSLPVHYYFTYESPNAYYRQYNLSVFNIILYAQCAWFLLRTIPASERKTTRFVGVVCALYSFNIFIRAAVDLTFPLDPHLRTIGVLNSVPYLLDLLCFISIAFGLNLMLSRRLHLDLEIDIERRRASEKALKDSETRYRRLVEGAPAIVYAFSPARGGIYYSSGLETILGYPQAYAQQHPFFWHDSIHRDDLERLSAATKKACSGEMIELDYRIKNQQGDWLWIRDLAIGCFQEGEETVMERVAYDVTSFKEAEQALLDREQLYRSLFENSISPMLLIYPDTGEIADVNPAAIEFYGYSKERFLTMTIQEINTLSKEEIFIEMENARATERNYFVFQHRISDGSTRDVEVYSGPIELKEKQLLCSIIHDISEKNRTAREREQLIEKLQEALQQVKTLSGLLPICASCKKIRDDQGYWSQLETYFESRSELLFSHGICPQCLEERHPKTYQKLKKEGKL